MSSERVTCIINEGFPVSLMIGKTYEVLPDEQGTKHGLIRVIDETGEDYLYPSSYFVAGEGLEAGVDRQSGVNV